MNVFALHSTQIDEWWPQIRPLVERCEVRQVEWSANLVRVRLKEAEAQFWGVHDGTGKLAGGCITQIERGVSGLIGRVWIASGNFKGDSVKIYRSIIEPWFVEKGCELIMIDGRKGWIRLLPDFDVVSVKLMKRLIPAVEVH